MAPRFQILVCRGPECGDRHGSNEIHEAFQRELLARGLTAAVTLAWQSCFGRCTQGPNVLIGLRSDPSERRFAFAALPGGRSARSALYNGCSPADAAELIDRHIVRGELVRRLIRPIAPATDPPPSAAPADRSPKPGRPDGDR